ncbi:MAG: DUF4398 domain-containing protein [Paraglaciecola sp.]|nr:DUF4398 domain-containing protein [Paraglaciecola sp.]
MMVPDALELYMNALDKMTIAPPINSTMLTTCFLVLLTTSLLLLASCASVEKAPTAELLAAEQAITRAEQAQATRYSSIELNTARTEISAARVAVLEKKPDQAICLALQAQVSAELAIANAELMKASAINKDMQRSIEVLQLETQRNLSGVK